VERKKRTTWDGREVQATEHLPFQGFIATRRRVLGMVSAIRVFVEDVR
jgi:hypothetical protein